MVFQNSRYHLFVSNGEALIYSSPPVSLYLLSLRMSFTLLKVVM